MLVETILKYKSGLLSSKSQKKYGITYAKKINKIDQIIDFNKPANILLRQINALSPFPGAKCKLKGEVVKIIKAQLVKNTEKVKEGKIISDDLIIKCKTDAIRVVSLQRPGKKIMTTKEVLNGWKITKENSIEKIIL